MQNVKLNLIPGSVMPVVNVSQYDVGRQFSLSVYEGAASYSLTGKSVQIRGTKPDGNGFAYDATDGVVSVSGSTVTISTTQQMTAVGGQTMAELRITSGDTILGTLNFVLMVEPAALSDDTPISDTDIPAIERDFEAALAEAEADALVAEGYAKGTQGGVPVGSGSPYYNNNAEHFKDEAEDAASDVLEKYPKIVSDYWYVWDVATNQYVNTGVRAKGTQGDPGEGVPAGGTTGQVLRKKSDDNYDTEWANGGGGASALDDLSDVDLTSPAEGDLLQYNPTSQKWENSNAVPQELAAMQEAGAVNILKIIATSQTINGVTITINGDGSITFSGTANGNIQLLLNYDGTYAGDVTDATPYIGKDMTISTGLSVAKIGLNIKCNYYKTNQSGAQLSEYTGTSTTFATPSDASKFAVFLTISNGTDFTTPVTIKPMFYDARFGEPPYQAFSMTNRELTDAVDHMAQKYVSISPATTGASVKTYIFDALSRGVNPYVIAHETTADNYCVLPFVNGGASNDYRFGALQGRDDLYYMIRMQIAATTRFWNTQLTTSGPGTATDMFASGTWDVKLYY